MNKTHQELCDEVIQLREQLESAQASTNLARLTKRQAMARIEQLENALWGACAQINDLAATLGRIGEATGVPAEPHQGIHERIIEAAERAVRERDHANTVAARYLEELHDTQRGMCEARAERDAGMKELLEHVISKMPRRVPIEAQLDWLVGEKWKIEGRLHRQAEEGAA